ncbi:MAG: TetR/AcrR family transcriptional regulator [Hyphomonadaceae bacterium]|nr:TetR/AcrR family transcriptional regulator [Hyphomonadaceae bacterium]
MDAAKLVLAEDGFQSFGVNAIARRAACDKQLIYRYFGGLEGLADAIGADLALKLADDLTPLSDAERPTSYGALSKILILGLLDLLRRDPIMQQIIAWELAAPSPLVSRLVAERGKRLGAWMHALRGSLTPPAGIDAPATNALLIASTQQLVLSASSSGALAGMPIKTEADWQRARSALIALIDGVYGAKPPTRKQKPRPSSMG